MPMPVPKRGEAITVHYSRDDKTYAAVLLVDNIRFESTNTLVITGQVRGAGELKGIDSRLDNQKQAIDRLLDHLKVHCPALTGEGKCTHVGGEETND
jgi:hypothetical protein